MYTAPDVPLTAVLARAPSGRAGFFHTVRTMRALVREWRTSPAMISAAVQLVYLHPPKDSHAEIGALFEFVRDSVRYVRDVHEVETLATPLITWQRKAGDCDDKATLLATLAESIGYPTRFALAAFDGGDYSHVWVQIMADDGWIDADPTEHQPLGWSPAETATRTWLESIGVA